MYLDGRLVFIGGGMMAEAIIKRIIAQNLVDPTQVVASEPLESRRRYLADQYSIHVTDQNDAAVADAAVVVLAVKPQVLDAVLPELKEALAPHVLVISIMAGVRSKTLESGLAHARIVRSMPNTPAQVGQGMTVWTAADAVSAPERAWAEQLLEAMGDTLFVADEHYLDAATGLSGSGPGFVFLFAEALIDAGVHIGFTRADAQRLAVQTLEGSIALLRQSGTHPAELRNRVTSPAGTTAAGSLVLERAGLRAAVIDAVAAAYLRSVELGDRSESIDA